MFKMATAERREARRRKVLQNPEDRLKKIMGSRSSHLTASHAPPDSDENFGKSNILEKNKNVNREMEEARNEMEGQENLQMARGRELLSDRRGLQLEHQATEAESIAGFCESRDSEPERDMEITPPSMGIESPTNPHSPQDTSMGLPQNTVLLPLGANKAVNQERPNSESNRWRVVFNVVLAFVLVSKWAYVNLEVLLSTGANVDDELRTGSPHKLLFQSVSMMWPFLALQLFLVCVARFQKTSHSPFISMLTVALQLCGIPIKFTHKINFVVTALLAALKDFVVFLFSVIIIHHAVEYCIKSRLLKQGLEYFQ